MESVLLRFNGLLLLLYLYVRTLGKCLDCFDKGHAIMFHKERDGVASLPTAKTLVCAGVGRDVEGASLLLMERT